MAIVKAVLSDGPRCGVEIEFDERLLGVHVPRSLGDWHRDGRGELTCSFVSEVYPNTGRLTPDGRLILQHARAGEPARPPAPPGPGPDGGRS